jgi:hypothetical protein
MRLAPRERMSDRRVRSGSLSAVRRAAAPSDNATYRRPLRVLLAGPPPSQKNRWCPGEDSNLHDLHHWYLKPARLPIPPPGQGGET